MVHTASGLYTPKTRWDRRGKEDCSIVPKGPVTDSIVMSLLHHLLVNIIPGQPSITRMKRKELAKGGGGGRGMRC